MMDSITSKSKNAGKLNEKGFTILEMLFSLTLFLLIVGFLPLGLRTVVEFNQFEKRMQRLEWEVFISQVKKEMRMAEQITVQHDRIFVYRNNEKILYEKYGSSLRRRVDLKGHEILIQNIKSVGFSYQAGQLAITIIDLFGQEYITRFTPLIRGNVS